MYRFFSIVVIIFALLGGGYAGVDLYQKYLVSESPVDVDQAKGFAAAFVRAYLTVEGGMPASMGVYTDLADQRNIDEAKEIKEAINQRVLGVWPVKTKVLAGNHMNVRLTAVVEREMPNKQAYEQKQNRLVTYQLDVPITQGPTGFRVTQYPKMVQISKDSQAIMPTIGTTDTQAEIGMKPMLMSFFRTYFEGQRREDITNFFADATIVPRPQNGLFLFEKIDSIQAYPVEKQHHWFVLLNIRVKDPYTNMYYPFSYALNVVRDGEKFYILSFNE